MLRHGIRANEMIINTTTLTPSYRPQVGKRMEDIYMTMDEAEEIVMAAQVGANYGIDEEKRSRHAHAVLLLRSRDNKASDHE